jgi:hypothetical protein
MAFRITGLSPEAFLPLYGLPDDDLAARGVLRVRVDAPSGYPDRIEMREAAPGETVLLLNHCCQPADTPYRATHAIYVREGATATYDRTGEVPEVMRRRLLSVRAFDARGMMLDAEVVEGVELEPVIARLFADPAVAYLHAHNARRGCYSGRIDRA